jgi:hypothetical protein
MELIIISLFLCSSNNLESIAFVLYIFSVGCCITEYNNI